jgi:CRISPR type III-A-associated protein Csm2
MDTQLIKKSNPTSNTAQTDVDAGKHKNQSFGWSEDEKKSDRYIRSIFTNDYVELILGDIKFNGEGYNDYIDRVKRFIYDRKNYDNMTASQLRNIFARVQKINSHQKLCLLRPKLAFIAGKSDTTHAMKTMIFLLDQLIANVDDGEKLKQFKAFYEAVIAYHKYYGGKE